MQTRFFCLEYMIETKEHRLPILIMVAGVVDCLKVRPHIWIYIITMILIKNFIPIDLVNRNFQSLLVKIHRHGLHSTSLLSSIHLNLSSSSDYNAYSNYRGDPYAAPLQPDLTVAYQQAQQHPAYPPANQPRQQQHGYGNTPGAPASAYTPSLGQYYGAQQRV